MDRKQYINRNHKLIAKNTWKIVSANSIDGIVYNKNLAICIAMSYRINKQSGAPTCIASGLNSLSKTPHNRLALCHRASQIQGLYRLKLTAKNNALNITSTAWQKSFVG